MSGAGTGGTASGPRPAGAPAGQWRLTGRIQLGLPPGEAFALFTPRGEQDWVPGWAPSFPATATDDSLPGTVFETAAHGRHTTWIVLEREWGRRLSYARVTSGHSAGTVTVLIGGAAQGGSDVEVTYALTALTRAARPELSAFAESYPAFLLSWQDAIAKRTSADVRPGP